ncbi:UPF0102 [Desulfonema limicola]|uniref:UPF0102 protein dnl_20290 n=1 Tax=Desulfonema limicola TaxID=45656 RepID=A0A975GFW9_9BACT|nr:YraN family protein [Desulfonema limicola]QTA79751.1 UPF0102 [Desulfonema limicola]
MLNEQQIFGQTGEALSCYLLEQNGYIILEKNFKTKMGEIDIIARDKNTIVFIEVKARRTGNFGNPKYAVNWKKKKKISMAALYYLKTTNQSNAKARFDVVSIISEPSKKPQIEIIKNAFELAYG